MHHDDMDLDMDMDKHGFVPLILTYVIVVGITLCTLHTTHSCKILNSSSFT
jgi:hypothetical protein